MARTLAAFAASGAPLAERLRVAHELARAVAELHARGRVHGALAPERALLVGEGTVVLAPDPAPGPPLATAPFAAPEVARGGTATARSDVFAAGALAWLVLAGRAPFDAAEPLERLRRAMYADPGPLRLAVPELPLEVEATIAAALEKRPRRRATARELARVLGEALARAAANPTSTATSTPTSTSTSTATATPTPTPTTPRTPAMWRIALEARLRAVPAACRARLAALSPHQRAAVLVALAIGGAVAALPGRHGALQREIESLVERGDVAEARRRLDALAAERRGDAVVEKLRGDVACAAGQPWECLRRYRVALARRPELREDERLRANTRRLIRPGEACSTRRAAAHLLGELHDPEALPALEEAQRSAGVLAWFCTGDSLERAITATRAASR